MKKYLLLSFILMPILSLVFVSFVLLLPRLFTKQVKGSVFDCRDNGPIVGSSVRLSYDGWGIRDGTLVWDKTHVFSATTDQKGEFEILYRGNPTRVEVFKEGYVNSIIYTYPKDFISLGMHATTSSMLKEKEGAEVTYTWGCKLPIDCIKVSKVNGVKVTEDVCFGE